MKGPTAIASSPIHTIVIGTRGSQLALAQTRQVIKLLTQARPDIALRVHTIRTRGDRDQSAGLARMGGEGVFVKEIEAALLDREIDLAVHSLKDVPTTLRPGLVIAAVPEREEPRDAFVGRQARTLDELPPGARIGTSSLRRQAQLRARRPDLAFVPLRGNVDTRLRKLAEEDLDGIVLAAAGLARLGQTNVIGELLDVRVCTPAAGQGALAIQCREDDEELVEILKPLEHSETRACVEAERTVLAELRCGCAVPVGVIGSIAGETLEVHGVVCSPDGSRVIRETERSRAADAQVAGRDLAQRLLQSGAVQILNRLRQEANR